MLRSLRSVSVIISCWLLAMPLVQAQDEYAVVECGEPALLSMYCYAAYDTLSWTYEASGAGTLKLVFDRGTIEGSTYDKLAIYDGTDNTAPVLFVHTTGTTNLGPLGSAINSTILLFQSVDVTSSTGYIHMELTSDNIIQCATSTTYDPLEWRVFCLDCTIPTASVSVLEDCDLGTFEVVVNVTSVGDGGPAILSYTVDGGIEMQVTGVGVGTTTLGPFSIGEEIMLSLLHGTSPLCNVPLGIFTDAGICPTPVACGGDAVEATYCYVASDEQYWLYEAQGTGTMKLVFIRGTIEGTVYEDLVIYDGPDANSPILFEHTTGTTNLGLPGSAINSTVTLFQSVDVTATSGYIFMEMSSDPSVQCATSTNYDPWEWQVMCLDCSSPIATYEVVQDCPNFQYYVDVDITDMGSSQQLEVTNTGGAPVVYADGVGTISVGPFTSGEEVQVTLVHDANVLCSITSPIVVNPLCPTVICGTTPLVETYCYGPNENMAWAYGVPSTGQLRLVFDLGTIESSTWDVLRIYDGTDASAPLLFEHTEGTTAELGPDGSAVAGPGTFYYAVDVTSTGPNLYMSLTSDGIIQCENSTTYDPMQWQVFCDGCPAPGVDYQLVADCENLMYKATVNVTEISGPLGLQITEVTSGEMVSAAEVDAFNFATFFPLDSAISFIVVDLDNPGCTYESDQMVYTRDSCVFNSCGVDNYEVCYENEDDRWYSFRSEGDFPVALSFLGGHMLTNDNIVLYNGLDESGPVIFSGNNGGNLTGLTVNSSNPDHAITLRILSDGSGSCADGQATVPIRWDVGCGFVGIEENAQNNFRLFPNPTNGELAIALGEGPGGTITIRVMDMSGRLVLEQLVNGPRTTLDLGSIQNGQYMIQLATNTWIGTRSFQLIR